MAWVNVRHALRPQKHDFVFILLEPFSGFSKIEMGSKLGPVFECVLEGLCDCFGSRLGSFE